MTTSDGFEIPDNGTKGNYGERLRAMAEAGQLGAGLALRPTGALSVPVRGEITRPLPLQVLLDGTPQDILAIVSMADKKTTGVGLEYGAPGLETAANEAKRTFTVVRAPFGSEFSTVDLTLDELTTGICQIESAQQRIATVPATGFRQEAAIKDEPFEMPGEARVRTRPDTIFVESVGHPDAAMMVVWPTA